jgi:antitoxin MazE
MQATIKKWGNSLALRIPKNIADELSINEGSQINFELIDGTLNIHPIQKCTVHDVIRGLNLDDLPELVEYGIAGKENEIWLEDTSPNKTI